MITGLKSHRRTGRVLVALLIFLLPAGQLFATGQINPSTGKPGNYTLHYQITGGNGCAAVDATAPVAVNALPVSSVLNQTNITCYAANDGTITVSAGGGSGPYTFSIDNGVSYLPPTGTNSRLFSGLMPNNPYKIRVKDNTWCESKSVQ